MPLLSCNSPYKLRTTYTLLIQQARLVFNLRIEQRRSCPPSPLIKAMGGEEIDLMELEHDGKL